MDAAPPGETSGVEDAAQSPTLDLLARGFVFGLLGVLLAGIAYELTFALGPPGPVDPWRTTAPDWPVIAVELGLLLGATLVLLTIGATTRAREALTAVRALPLVGLAAVSLVVARDFAYDLSELPARRYVEGGVVSPAWLVVLVVVGVVGALVVRSRVRAAVLVTAAILWISVLSAVLVPTGH